jgi:hypothetical protein
LLAKHLRRDAAPVLTEEQQLEALRREAFVNTLKAGYWPWGAMRPSYTRNWMFYVRIHQYLTDSQPALLAFNQQCEGPRLEEDSAGNKATYHIRGNVVYPWADPHGTLGERNHPSVGCMVLTSCDANEKLPLYVEAGQELCNRTDLCDELDKSTGYMTIANKENASRPLLFVTDTSLYKWTEQDKKMAEDILRGQKSPEEIYDTYKPASIYGTKEGLLAYAGELARAKK